MVCSRCKTPLLPGEERTHDGRLWCEDCYIDTVMPKVRKMFYENDPAEFMRRLKTSYSAHPQRYH